MNGNGLRLVVMPSFSDWYGLALYRNRQGRGTMLLTRLQQPSFDSEDPLAPIQIAAMTTQSPDYARQLAWFDRWVEQHGQATSAGCIDGTPTAFERVVGDEITSGLGNCERSYDLLKQRMLALAKQHFPDAPLPAVPDWHEVP